MPRKNRKGLADKRQRHDPVYRRAKADGYAGRAVYKLREIDERFRLLKPGATVLDLGCWPGSWLQYVYERCGDEATIVGLDLKEVELGLPGSVTTLVGDVDKLKPGPLVRRYGVFDVTLSDMAPNTTGNPDADVTRSEDLLLRALEVGTEVMRPGGHFAAKVFQGPRFKELLDRVKATFSEHKAFRAPSTRKQSREQYIVGRGLRASASKARAHLRED